MSRSDLEARLQLLQLLDRPFRSEMMTLTELSLLHYFLECWKDNTLCQCQEQRMSELMAVSKQRDRNPNPYEWKAKGLDREEHLQTLLTQLGMIDKEKYGYYFHSRVEAMIDIATRMIEGEACDREVEQLKKLIIKCGNRYERKVKTTA